MDPDDYPNADHPPDNNRKRKDLTSEQRRGVVRCLLMAFKEGPQEEGEERQNFALQHGALAKVAGIFGVVPSTASRIWKMALKSNTDVTVANFQASPQKKGNCGRHQKWNRDDVREAVKTVPTHQRKTLRKLGSALGIPKSTLHVMKQSKIDCVIVPHSNAINI